MKIELTNEQYESLLKLVYLGAWMANANRVEAIEEFESIESHIYSFSEKAGTTNLVDYAKELENWLPTRELEESMQPLVEEYDNDTLFDDLIDQLSTRDAIRMLGSTYVAMSAEERFVATGLFVEKYATEFEQFGLINLEIVHKAWTDPAGGQTI